MSPLTKYKYVKDLLENRTDQLKIYENIIDKEDLILTEADVVKALREIAHEKLRKSSVKDIHDRNRELINKVLGVRE